jgi:hypothetical protein
MDLQEAVALSRSYREVSVVHVLGTVSEAQVCFFYFM